MGETCGMKLVMQTLPTGTECKTCEKIDTKMRRRAAEVDRIGNWQKEGIRSRTSIDQAMDVIRGLDSEICELSCERSRRLEAISNEFPTSGDRGLAKPASVSKITFELIDKTSVSCGLPITFETLVGPATVMAIPDSGSDFNIISLDLALHLGYKTDESVDRGAEIQLLDGLLIRSVGVVRAVCRFGRTFYSEPRNFHCLFRVLRNTISLLIMSSSFLQETQTWTTFRNRPVPLPEYLDGPLRIRALGQTRRLLECLIDGCNAMALADSGSDTDLITLRYAQKRGWKLRSIKQDVVLADGRRKQVLGVCEAQLSVGKDGMIVKPEGEKRESKPTTLGSNFERVNEIGLVHQKEHVSALDMESGHVRHVIQTDFFVLGGIMIDVLIGASLIESLKVFSHHSDKLTLLKDADAKDGEMHRISLAKWARSPSTRSNGARSSGAFQLNKGVFGSTLTQTVNSQDLQQQLNNADQQENARREAADAEAASLIGDAKAIFDDAEKERRRGYDEYRAQLLHALSTFL
jgi:hypothetical protein